MSVEGILAHNVAVIIDCETDNKLRTLADVREVMKKYSGTATPTNYLFAKKGRIVFEKKEGTGVDEVFDQALEAGALDVIEDAEGRVVVFTEPSDTKSTGEALSGGLGLNIASSDIIWDPNEDTMVPLSDSVAAKELSEFVDALQDKDSSVQGIYMNVAQGSIDEGAWAELKSRIDA